VTNRGNNFLFGLGMYFQTGQVFFFVPEWLKGEFVRFWSYSVFGQKYLFVKDASQGFNYLEML